MENTEKVLFEDDSPHWYIAMGERWIGPVSASDVYERVTSQEISWAHFVWKPGQAEWKRLCDVKSFQGAVPRQPAKKLQNEVKEGSKPNMKSSAQVMKTAQGRSEKGTGSSEKAKPASQRAWFLYYNDTQFGPFTKEEIENFLSVGKVTPRVHAWKTGMTNWTRLKDIEIFGDAESAPAKTTKAQQKKEQRTAPRRPMVAKILMHNNRSVTEAMCRDISVGGMQVLTDELPGAVGAKIRLNVSMGAMDPFVAEGEIVRILEDSRGFSFRFNRLSEGAKKAIEKYIQS
jgi:PilZ domain/GYF domain 2